MTKQYRVRLCVQTERGYFQSIGSLCEDVTAMNEALVKVMVAGEWMSLDNERGGKTFIPEALIKTAVIWTEIEEVDDSGRLESMFTVREAPVLGVHSGN